MYFKKLFDQATIIFSVVIIWLYITNKLTLYIHPRYELFTVTFSAFALIFYSICLAQNSNHKTHKSVIFVFMFSLIALLIPATPLSIRTAENRTQQNQIARSTTPFSSYDNFNQDFSYFDVADLSSILSENPTDSQIVGKKASVEGFLFKDNNEQFYIARFKLACCAVDATPLVVPINIAAIKDPLVVGDWYKATGLFALNNQSSGHKFTVDVEKIEPIAEPEEPYVY